MAGFVHARWVSRAAQWPSRIPRSDVVALSVIAVGPRVLVVGINYDPEHAGVAPYTTQAAEHLQAQGADVFVITGVPHYPNWVTPRRYKGSLRVEEEIRGVRVRRLRHYVPSTQSAVTRSLYEASFGAHVLSQRLPWKPDVVLAIVPSLLGAVAARRLAEQAGARFILWLQDLIGPAATQSGISGGRRIAVGATRVERSVIRRAHTVLVLSEGFRKYVEATGLPPDRVRVVRNWTHIVRDTGHRESLRQALGWGFDETVVLHTGNMGLKQGLDNVVKAAEAAAQGDVAIRFVLMGDGSQREALEAASANLANLSFMPPASAEDYPSVLAAADVLLVNERGSATEMSLPSKLTSYFEARRPVLAAVPIGGATSREVEASGAGEIVPPEDPDALLAGVIRISTSGRESEYAAAAAEFVRRNLRAEVCLEAISSACLGEGTARQRRGAHINTYDAEV